MNNFTPGPWEVVSTETKDGFRIQNGCATVAHVYGETQRKHRYERNGEDNARLIAAAPELLEALETLWSFYKDLSRSNPGFLGKLGLQDYEQYSRAMRKVPAAIEKAKGGAA